MRSVAKVQEALIDHGAVSIQMMYDADKRRYGMAKVPRTLVRIWRGAGEGNLAAYPASASKNDGARTDRTSLATNVVHKLYIMYENVITIELYMAYYRY
jgi:hypothetical protein